MFFMTTTDITKVNKLVLEKQDIKVKHFLNNKATKLQKTSTKDKVSQKV